MKSFLTTFFCLFIYINCHSQVAVNYFPFKSWLGISSSTEKLLWAEFRLETNTFITNLNSELSPMVNVKRGEIVNYYLGPGINFNVLNSYYALNILNGYFLSVGSRIKPFQKVRNLNFIFEVSPYVNKDFNSGVLRTNLGISYHFGKMRQYQNSNNEAE